MKNTVQIYEYLLKQGVNNTYNLAYLIIINPYSAICLI
jgi:hypothetical protein